MEHISYKQRYFEETTDAIEVKPNPDLTTIGEFQTIDELEDEVWLLQCPKGFDVAAELQSQKLKLPGRTNFNTAEAVAVEYSEKVSHTFGYCNRKGRYALRRLPIRGNILLRGRLKARVDVTEEAAVALCPPAVRVPMPEFIKVRHPLHGHQFDKRLRVNKDIAERLKKADELSAQISHETRLSLSTSAKDVQKGGAKKKKSQKAKVSEAGAADAASTIQIDSGNDDDVEFVSEAKSKKKKRKHQNSESSVAENDIKAPAGSAHKKKKKSKSSQDIEEVSADLQWLQHL